MILAIVETRLNVKGAKTWEDDNVQCLGAFTAWARLAARIPDVVMRVA